MTYPHVTDTATCSICGETKERYLMHCGGYNPQPLCKACAGEPFKERINLMLNRQTPREKQLDDIPPRYRLKSPYRATYHNMEYDKTIDVTVVGSTGDGKFILWDEPIYGGENGTEAIFVSIVRNIYLSEYE